MGVIVVIGVEVVSSPGEVVVAWSPNFVHKVSQQFACPAVSGLLKNHSMIFTFNIQLSLFLTT